MSTAAMIGSNSVFVMSQCRPGGKVFS